MNPFALAAAVSLVASLLLIPVAGLIAAQLGLVVKPRQDRWGQRAIPTLGGLGIAAAIALGLLVGPLPDLDRWAIITVGAIMVGLGFADDVRTLPPTLRLLVEALAGTGFTLVVLDGTDPLLRFVAGAAAGIAFPLVINATNLVDNADGSAASLSTATALTLALAAHLARLDGSATVLGVTVGGACLGFIAYNRPPARVFMGDTGSLMLGATLAAGSVLLVRDAVRVGTPLALAAGLVVLFAWQAQLGDMTMVVLSRRRRGLSPFRGGVDHTTHRLLRLGFGPLAMLAVVVGVAVAVDGLGLILVGTTGSALPMIVGALAAGLGVIGFELLLTSRSSPTPDLQAVSAGPTEEAN
jgi:UDP-GlcNAc:undecaprenyl-phosphate GlcNAc-1-phosphate transferase